MKLNPAAMVVHVWTTVGVTCVLVLKDGQARTVNKTLVSFIRAVYISHFARIARLNSGRDLLAVVY